CVSLSFSVRVRIFLLFVPSSFPSSPPLPLPSPISILPNNPHSIRLSSHFGATFNMHRPLAAVLLLVCAAQAGPSTQRCIHGSIKMGKCECEDGFAGSICHREMHCTSFDRSESGGCTACLQGWEGSDCDKIVCVNGKADPTDMHCTCNAPYSGDHCDELETKNVYSHYNNKAASVSPVLLSITIIPLAIIVWACNTYSKKRRAKKVEHLLELEVNRDLKSSHVRQLLYGKN
ncbi:hypothetical protein PFISCL1PPCAC_8739, partial [Pristionchus fissidentatus]